MKQFNGTLPTSDQLIEAHGGDHRAAESEAWEAWEYNGKKKGCPYAMLAIAVAEKKHGTKEDAPKHTYGGKYVDVFLPGKAPAGYVK